MTPDDLSLHWRFLYEERAAIREHCGGATKEVAEREAMAEIVELMAREEKRQHRGLYR